LSTGIASAIGPLRGVAHCPRKYSDDFLELPIDYFFSFHSLKEVRMSYLMLEMRSNTRSSPDAPLFHTLKVLIVYASCLSPLASQKFHKLERYQEGFASDVDEPRQDRLTEMPVCTRLVTSLSRLATLKLPHVRELEVLVGEEEEPDYLWEKHVAVNVQLSGLKLLSLSTAGTSGTRIRGLSGLAKPSKFTP